MKFKLFIHKRLNSDDYSLIRSSICHFLTYEIILLISSYMISMKYNDSLIGVFAIFSLASMIGHFLLFALSIPDVGYFTRNKFSFKKYEYLFMPFYLYLSIFFLIEYKVTPTFNKIYYPIINFLNKDDFKEIKKIEQNKSIVLDGINQKITTLKKD